MTSEKIGHNKKTVAYGIFRTAHNIHQFREGINRVDDQDMDRLNGRMLIWEEWTHKKYSSLYADMKTRKATLYIVPNRWYDFDF